jgi:HD-like signal output (HDOD) protein
MLKAMELAKLEAQIGKCSTLPAMPDIAVAVLRICDDPDGSAKELCAIIEKDASIAMRVLRAAGSTYYGQRGAMNLRQAVSLLGMGTIRSMVLGCVLRGMVEVPVCSKRFRRQEFWRHTLGTAVVGKMIAQMRLPFVAEDLYCAGLLHNIGMVTMDRFAPDDLDRAIHYADVKNLPIRVAEKEVLGYDHREVGEIMAERWGLPPLITKCLTHYHAPFELEDSQNAVVIIAVANCLAKHVGFDIKLAEVAEAPDQAWLDALELTEDHLVLIKNALETQIEEAELAIGIKPSRVHVEAIGQ